LQITDLSFSLEFEAAAPPRRQHAKRSGRDALRGWAKSAS
jgi:hypothetical protein